MPGDGLPRACYPVCALQSDCAAQTVCTEVNDGNDFVCLPVTDDPPAPNNSSVECSSPSDCPPRTPVCSPLGVCVQSDTDPCASVACDPGLRCVDGVCAQDPSNNPPGCSSDADCGPGEVCLDSVCNATPPPTGCTTDSECDRGEVCKDTECVEAPADGTCSASTPDVCDTGEFCNVFTGACEPLGEGDACGLCGPGCTCAGDLICQDGLCVGCSVPFDPDCAADTCAAVSGRTICQP